MNTAPRKICVICHEDKPEDILATFHAKGAETIMRCSEARGEKITMVPGDCVHVSCRKTFCNDRCIQQFLAKQCQQANLLDAPQIPVTR